MVNDAMEQLAYALPWHIVIFAVLALIYVLVGLNLLGLFIGYPLGAVTCAFFIAWVENRE